MIRIFRFAAVLLATFIATAPLALAQKARREHEAGKPFKVGVLTGASTGKSLDGALAGHHRLAAVLAHLLEMAGEREAAIAHYLTAAGRTTSLPERNYLNLKAARLGASV